MYQMLWLSEEQARSYPVAPNNTVPIWDTENQVIYLKSADVMGRPSMKILDYTIREEPKDEITLLKEKIAELEAKIGGADERIIPTDEPNGKIATDEPDGEIATVKK